MSRWGFWLLSLVACHRVFGVTPDQDPPLPPDGGLTACCVPDPRCSEAKIESVCVETLECTWSDTALCTGTHADCGSYKASAQCNAHAGCGWSPSVCFGMHAPCEDQLSVVECETHGCVPVTVCTGNPASCTAFNGNQAACDLHGCSYDGNSDVCRGVPAECEKYDSIAACVEAGCLVGLVQCTGTPHGCDAHAESACGTTGCTLAAAACVGTAQESCASFDEQSCIAHEGCGWSPMGGCAAPTDCGARSLEACASNGCELDLCAP